MSGQAGVFVSIIDQDLLDLIGVSNIKDIFVDGTHSLSEGNTQVVVAMALTGSTRCRAVPIGYFLVTGHTEATYTWVFERLRNCGINPERLRVDWESALHSASASIFPAADQIGCRFHTTQSWKRKYCSLNPGSRTNSKEWKHIKKLLDRMIEAESIHLLVICLVEFVGCSLNLFHFVCVFAGNCD